MEYSSFLLYFTSVSFKRDTSEYYQRRRHYEKMRNKINRYLDLFASQMELAFWIDAEECLNAIKTFVTSSIALNRKYNKDRIKNIIHKIKAISELDIDLESFYDTNDMIFFNKLR